MLPITATLDPTLWKPPAESQRVIEALSEPQSAQASSEPDVLFVGGCVRNSILGLEAGDADLATPHKPNEVTRRLEAAGIKVVPTGIDHGTVTAVVNKRPFEITTLRQDIETDGRHAVVAFTTTWEEDAQRRDFTMNTLLADLKGNIYDPTGCGLSDLNEGRVVFVGDPKLRVAEDYLRILRFFRFQALYGKTPPDTAALTACRQAAGKIGTLSRERITQEILKILAVRDPTETLELMRENKVMDDLFHPEFDPNILNMLCGLQNRFGSVSLESRLFVLCNGAESHLPVLDKYLLLSKDQRRVLESLFAVVTAPLGIKERLYYYGRHIGGQSILILAAVEDAKVGGAAMDLLRDWPIPVLPITGGDLKALGISPGPQMGKIMRAVEAWWADSDFQPGREDCLKQAKNLEKS